MVKDILDNMNQMSEEEIIKKLEEQNIKTD